MRLVYYLGDTYSKDRLKLIKELSQSFFELQTVDENSIIENADFFLYSPTVNGREIKLLKDCNKKNIRLILLLDHNHFEYADFQFHLDVIRPSLVITPQSIDYHSSIICESLYLYEVNQKIKINTIYPNSLCFISQPLSERGLGFTQIDLLKKVVEDLENSNSFADLYLKPHPREDALLPPDIKSKIKLWDGDIDSALASFKFFVGYNSLALLGAKSLGHHVTWLCPESKMNRNQFHEFQCEVENIFQKSLTILSAST